MVPQTPFKQTSKRPSRLLPPLASLSSQSVEQTGIVVTILLILALSIAIYQLAGM